MKKSKKIGITVVLLMLIGVIVYFVNGIWGNPISKLMAKKAANDYIEKNYSDQNLHIDEVVYNFKFGMYSAYAVSDTSMDTHFSIYVTPIGKVDSDDYDFVKSGWNTYERLQDVYRKQVDAVFNDPKFPLKSDIDFGELKTKEKSESEFNHLEYGIDLSTLELDKKYDVKELAKTAGHITFYAKDKEVSCKRASELLLKLKNELDQANVPFYAIDFVLQKSVGDEKPNPDGEQFDVQSFLYKDIKEEGLEARMQKAHDALTAYYKEQDELKSKGY